ncbi:ribonuclease P protein component [Paraglaciecola psychrophila]|uniref:Ribonuclease P protein component n=1 Tax=Paraglaciecola psychrophila 170 TaxID=1129794 RepID=K6YT16_9ALTE|nr:ribonuclease P protein component [Paraglaciecola psychrophila]AGH47728.1 ribonuclease P protein component [Paraglaciecola psychrophila 170]GAC35859.1 ribonuclease P protein component [Paraglaciecola psychrophila 170]
MGENNFSRELRLLTPTHFEYVFNNAIPSVSPQLTLLARYNKFDNPRLGITLAKKRVKHAHDRNRLKRVIRESFRLQRHSFPNIDIVVVGKTGLDKLSNQELFSLLSKLWKKLASRCEKSQSV